MVQVSNQTGIEIGLMAGKYPGRVGHMYSPGGQCGPWMEIPYALDNDAWPAAKNKRPRDHTGWLHLLAWAAMSGQQPLFAIVAGKVGDRDETMRMWDRHLPDVLRFGFRPAFAAQDGMTFGDVPLSDCMVFIGGSDEWKEDAIGPWCRQFMGRVHVGRVNTMRRLLLCYHAGAVSVDGTGWFRKGSYGNKGGSQRADLHKFLRESSNEDLRNLHVRGSSQPSERPAGAQVRAPARAQLDCYDLMCGRA